MVRLTDIYFEKFRGLRGLNLERLGRINLLVGINNSGKTSVLEGLSIYCNPIDLREWWSASFQREKEDRFTRTSIIDSFRWLFPQSGEFKLNHGSNEEFEKGEIFVSSNGDFPISSLFATYEVVEELREPGRVYRRPSKEEVELELMRGLEIEIKINLTSWVFHSGHLELDINTTDTDEAGNQVKNFSFQIWEDEPTIRFPRSRKYSVPIELVTTTSHRSESQQFRLLSEARYQDFKSDVISLLQSIDSSILDIEILADPSSISSRPRFSIYLQHEKLGLAPIGSFGDGIRRLLHIALTVPRAKGGILLIDELESTIHTEALQLSYSWLSKWCEIMDIQLFATTHSLEAVDALLEVTDSARELVLYRLEPGKEYTSVTRHDWDRLRVLREELGQEVRW
jgi:archaellum component FlaF (FlaF/FlaG flagellin family)